MINHIKKTGAYLFNLQLSHFSCSSDRYNFMQGFL